MLLLTIVFLFDTTIGSFVNLLFLRYFENYID